MKIDSPDRNDGYYGHLKRQPKLSDPEAKALELHEKGEAEREARDRAKVLEGWDACYALVRRLCPMGDRQRQTIERARQTLDATSTAKLSSP